MTDDLPLESRGRRRGERRRPGLRSALLSLVRSRRRGDRRREAGATYVDWHGPWSLVAALGIVLLSVVDAFLTGLLVSRGGRELNPLMAWLLDAGFEVFFAVKFLLTAGCVVLLLIHRRFPVAGRLTAYHLVAAVLLGYVALIHYELGLLRQAGVPLPVPPG